jgi:predicted HNH restriction endonuclease
MSNNRYPKNWQEIALIIKNKAEWRCYKCGKQCIRPGENTADLTKSERTKKTLVVHHANYTPEDNRLENLIPVCAGCHLGYHTRKKSNVLVGQLSLFE